MKKILRLSARINEERQNYFKPNKQGCAPIAILCKSFSDQIEKFRFNLAIDPGYSAKFDSRIECFLTEQKEQEEPFAMVLLDDLEKNELLLGKEVAIDDIVLVMDRLN
tara:strand:+ start:435 stop:758 length:324 start_codon:yes stop_codon:yes gene_type:complete